MAIGNAQRLDAATTEGLGAKARDRICELLATDPRSLDLDGALEIIDNLDQFPVGPKPSGQAGGAAPDSNTQ